MPVFLFGKKGKKQKTHEIIDAVGVSSGTKEVKYDVNLDIKDKTLEKCLNFALVDKEGNIIYSKSEDDIVDAFYVFPKAEKVLVTSDGVCEKYLKTDYGFVYVKSAKELGDDKLIKLAKKILDKMNSR